MGLTNKIKMKIATLAALLGAVSALNCHIDPASDTIKCKEEMNDEIKSSLSLVAPALKTCEIGHKDGYASGIAFERENYVPDGYTKEGTKKIKVFAENPHMKGSYRHIVGHYYRSRYYAPEPRSQVL